MRLGHRLALGLSAGLLLAGGAGCQAFVGIDDAARHLPRMDGEYLVAIDRLRADGVTRDTIRLSGTATLDVDTRSLDLALNILAFTGGATLSETSISGISFPDDSDEVEFTLNLSIPAGAIDPSRPPANADSSIDAQVIVIAEADYAFCAKPATAAALPTLGSILVETFSALPATADVTCDDPTRQ